MSRTSLRNLLLGAAVLAAPLLSAGPPPEALDADIVFLGEIHDNPQHHIVQAEWVAAVQPKAVVFEMLTDAQAERVTPELVADPGRMAEVLEWAASGWPDFALYHPIFAAAPNALVIGAGLPRARLGDLQSVSIAEIFGAEAELFALDRPLADEQQAAREGLQFAAHCDALPAEMLPMMVDIQRLRDAYLARATLRALEMTGGPVAVITGNGHARRDWGAPSMIDGPAVFVLGQSENGAGPEGGFDLVLDATPAERPDPCAAFR
ncbi:MAG: ChaN family lipoprotein [Pseudomonadota bacterium]